MYLTFPFLVQIMLYDTTRKLLTSRFLKQEEIIETGVSMAFGTHLVEVGEAEESKKPQVNLKVLGNNCNLVREIGKMQREQDCHTFNSSIPKGCSDIFVKLLHWSFG